MTLELESWCDRLVSVLCESAFVGGVDFHLVRAEALSLFSPIQCLDFLISEKKEKK